MERITDMLIYEDKSLCFHGDNDDIKYDAKKMSSFNEQLDSDYEWFKDRARILEGNYIKYCNNETFVGDAADASKKFIMDGQCGELHAKNILIKKEFVETCFDIEELFKGMVDSSSHARISTKVLLKIKKDFGVYYALIDTKGFEIERRTSRLVNDYSKWGITTIPNYNKPYVVLEAFCDNGGFLDECIRKLEGFDRDAYNYINGKDFITRAEALKTKINNTAGALGSMTVYQPNIQKASVSLVSLSTAAAAAAWNPFESLFGSSGKNIVVKKTYTEAEYVQSLKDQYGFTDEQAKLINKAYERYELKCSIDFNRKYRVNNAKIKEFFSNLAALNEGYATNTDFSYDPNQNPKENFNKFKGNFSTFNMLGTNPSTKDAIKFFDDLGLDGNALKEAVNEQHVNCTQNEKRDFVHECTIFSVMSDKLNGKKFAAGTLDDIDAAIGYKGDVYSGEMGIDDMKSDVEAYNIYHRMKDCKDGDIWHTMTEYNIGVGDGSVNGSKEFLEHLGKGDAKKGLENLKEDLDKETKVTDIISRNTTPERVQARKKEFLDFVSTKAGIK